MCVTWCEHCEYMVIINAWLAYMISDNETKLNLIFKQGRHKQTYTAPFIQLYTYTTCTYYVE